MGFLTRLLAGLTAAAALGTGLTGTANAVDVTGAAGTTKSVVKLADDGGNETSEDTADNPDDDSTDADSTTDAGAQSDAGQQAEIQSSTSQDKATAKSSLPDHIVNGSFDYPACPDGKNSCDVDPTTGWGGFYVDYGRKFMPIPDWDRSKFGWDSSQEGLRPDQQPNSHQKLQHCVQIGNKPNNNGQKMNRFAEIIAETPDEYIYQDIATTPGVMYRWSLKHASEDASHVDSMQVMIGSPGRETAQDATRTTSNGRGDRTGVTSKTIATKGGQAEWETYTGVYVATSTVTRFTFKSAQGRDSTRGNFIDDVMFTKAYKLTYDKNSADASGQVPSNQRGKENTTQPARTRTSGTVRTVADDAAGNVPSNQRGQENTVQAAKAKTNGTVKTVAEENAQYGSLANGDFSYPSFSDIQKNEQGGDADLRTFIKSDDGTLWYNMSATDFSKYGKIGQIPGFDSSRFAWSSTENGSRVELQQDRNTKNTYAEIVAQQDNTSIYQNVSTGNGGVLYKIRLKHASRQSSHADRMQVLVGADAAHATPVEMTRVTSNGHGDKVGGKSTTITTKVSNTDPRDHGAQWETYEGTYLVPEGQKNTVFMFKSLEGFKEDATLSGNNVGNLVDDIEFSRAYRLTYDKNSGDASGSVPSDTAANTTQPAKSETDGKVSDLVQRTTTHEDGSVTVRTVDQSTDVVSGCQVYYPAGQRITLATMAKDDDCWDSSMLSRPGHTQLGWNQDRNATQAQAEVTMVEGGMTVFAVWVGNPVLTYDTNKPSTWTGEMPSTPASVSVAYNTAAADGSGWQAGDVSKIRGYKFLGWYTGPQDNAGLYDWNTLLTGSVTVYAHWQRLQANVIYDKNGGTGSHANTTGWQYSDVTVPGDTSKSFKRDGYYFKYWNTQKDGKGTTYKDGGQVPLQDKDVTLYAIWAPYHTVITETGGVGLPVLVAAGMGLLVVGIGSTVMLTRRMRGEQ